MARLIKRYGSRKLYDTEESRYVSLEDISTWVRNGDDIEVQDNATGEDVTVQTLTQVISEEGRKGASFLPSDLLHDLIRVGNNAVTDRVRKFQDGFEGFVKKSFNSIVPVSTVRTEMDSLRQRLDELETALTAAQQQEEAAAAAGLEAPAKAEAAKAEEKPKRATRARSTKSSTSKTGTRKTTTRSTAAKSTASKSAASKAKSTTTKRTTRRSTAKKATTAAANDSTKTQKEEVTTEA